MKFNHTLVLMVLHLLLFSTVPCRTGEPASPIKRVDSWPPAAYSKVIGYSYAYTGGEGGRSLLESGTLDETRLKKLQLKQATLNAEQVDRLLTATFASKTRFRSADCYDPRHVFVFYDADSKPAAAIEICFGCVKVESMPAKKIGGDERYTQGDFEALARLSIELGLGLGTAPIALEEYLENLKGRKRE